MKSIYLDNAATSFPKPECVYEAVDACLRGGGSAFGRGSHSGTDAAGRLVAQCRQRVARVIDAESPEQVAFTFNCTDGLNLLLRGLLRPGDRVVTTTLEHNSVLRPLEQLRSEFELDVQHIDFDPGTGIVDVASLESALEKPTRLVVINHASNVTGTVQPIADITRAARKTGALVLLDAAQTAGHLPFSVRELRVDLLAAAGHKGMLGPLGTGFVYLRTGLQSELRPVRCGGTGTSSESILQPDAMPAKLESGNLNVPGIAGLNAAAEWILNETVTALHQRLEILTHSLKSALQKIPDVTIYAAEQSSSVGIVSLNIGSLDCRDVAVMLDQSAGVQCRAGLHCAPLVHRTLGTFDRGGTIRLSPGPFTSENEIAAVVEAIDRIAASFR
ncbi:MAG: aminotransferase class V-fold PLP-dependent enzyme [Planctomycetaceae bacterium]